MLIGVLNMQLFMCKALVLSCFFVFSFVYLFINYSLKIFLWEFCVHVFIYNNFDIELLFCMA